MAVKTKAVGRPENVRDRTNGSRAATAKDRRTNYLALKKRWEAALAAVDDLAEMEAEAPIAVIKKAEALTAAVNRLANVYKIMHPATAPDAIEDRRAVGDPKGKVTEIKSWARKR